MANEYLNNDDFESIICSFQFYKRQKSKYELIVTDLKETHDRRKSKYKDNEKRKDLRKAENKYKEVCNNLKESQEKLAYSFYILCENIAQYCYIKGLVKDLDEAIQEGVVICLEKVDRFNPNYIGKNGQKAKAFNYMSTCIFNHYRQMFRSFRNYNELKKRYHTYLQENFEGVFLKNGKERANNHRSSIDSHDLIW